MRCWEPLEFRLRRGSSTQRLPSVLGVSTRARNLIEATSPNAVACVLSWHSGPLSGIRNVLSGHLLRTSFATSFQDLFSRPLRTSSHDIFFRISLNTSFEDLLPQPSLRTPLRNPSPPLIFSRLLSRPLQDVLPRDLLKSSLMSSFGALLSPPSFSTPLKNPHRPLRTLSQRRSLMTFFEDVLLSSQDVLSRHLRTSLKTSFEEGQQASPKATTALRFANDHPDPCDR